MLIIKSLALAALLSLGFSTQATTVNEGISEDAILLFNGDETPVDKEEVAALSEDESADSHMIGVRRAHVRCKSFPYFTTTCHVQSRVISVRLVSQFGYRNCIAGRNWGATRNSVWVRGGCSGNFVVRYLPGN